jgi:hypothetical protein
MMSDYAWGSHAAEFGIDPFRDEKVPPSNLGLNESKVQILAGM